jgi:hypothetical protein
MSKTLSKSKKNYVKGSAKLVTFPDGGELINLDLNLESLSNLTVNERGYVKLTLSRLKIADQFGNGYSVYENDYKPEPKTGGAPAPKGPIVRGPQGGGYGGKKGNDMPF